MIKYKVIYINEYWDKEGVHHSLIREIRVVKFSEVKNILRKGEQK